jgi:hypothetical protein
MGQRLVLPSLSSDDIAAIGGHIDAVDLALTAHQCFPKTRRAVDELRRLVALEEQQVTAVRDEALAKAALREKLRARAVQAR